ncbi:MAG: hypothetical protein PHF37_10390 [Phycisphaerae bacterium]|nr:hypothetical protein [Phycisphaerae bacterium]
MVSVATLLASFTSPIFIGTDPYSMLWLFPLALAIATVYKATKVDKIKFADFAREVTLLFLSIVVFIVAAAVALYFIQWIVLE